MAGRLVISLDFELMWGVRDHKTVGQYGDAVLGGRHAIPKILSRFAKAGINATWATVGLLFARNRDEMIDHSPALQPSYLNRNLSPYSHILHSIGRNEIEDPLHFGASLLQRIRDTDGQEIATHTFSHYFCLEPGQTLTEFEYDIRSALSIAQTWNVEIKSIVFPRNQLSSKHVEACRKVGVEAYRGNIDRYAYHSRSGRGQTWLIRGFRYLDSLAPVYTTTYPLTNAQPGTSVNVPASRFLRPYSRAIPGSSALHLSRILGELEAAARLGRAYHIWWHPHNFGRNTDRNLHHLDAIIRKFVCLSGDFGLESVSMDACRKLGLSGGQNK